VESVCLLLHGLCERWQIYVLSTTGPNDQRASQPAGEPTCIGAVGRLFLPVDLSENRLHMADCSCVHCSICRLDVASDNDVHVATRISVQPEYNQKRVLNSLRCSHWFAVSAQDDRSSRILRRKGEPRGNGRAHDMCWEVLDSNVNLTPAILSAFRGFHQFSPCLFL
jgi:hypothetical protein